MSPEHVPEPLNGLADRYGPQCERPYKLFDQDDS
jgi:hypothetical protein